MATDPPGVFHIGCVSLGCGYSFRSFVLDIAVCIAESHALVHGHRVGVEKWSAA